MTPLLQGCIVFDDYVLNKHYSDCIERVHYQHSGNAHGANKGIGLVNC